VSILAALARILGIEPPEPPAVSLETDPELLDAKRRLAILNMKIKSRQESLAARQHRGRQGHA